MHAMRRQRIVVIVKHTWKCCEHAACLWLGCCCERTVHVSVAQELRKNSSCQCYNQSVVRIVDCKIATWPAGSCYNRFGTWAGWSSPRVRCCLMHGLRCSYTNCTAVERGSLAVLGWLMLAWAAPAATNSLLQLIAPLLN